MRSRNIKPGFFENELLGMADPIISLLFAGLWMLADKEGRLVDNPLRIKGKLFPYREISRDHLDGFLSWLAENGFITRYDGGTHGFLIEIRNWQKHQSPHHQEKKSMLPPSSQEVAGRPGDRPNTFDRSPEITRCNRSDSLIPDSSLLERGTTSPNPSVSKAKVDAAAFVPPTIAEVRAYCVERSNHVDAEAFVAFYESKGWMVGKNRMKDWKASVRTWERRNGDGSSVAESAESAEDRACKTQQELDARDRDE